MSVQTSIEDLRKEIIRKRNGKYEYRIINSFAGTTAQSESMSFPFLRRFQPIKEERHRRSNIESGFDYYVDSLMDYPSIIQSKLGGDVMSYNMLISVHVPICPYKCWHCYNNKNLHLSSSAEWYTAEKIIEAFIEQRKFDNTRSIKSNVLRITGGEPFLVPELILECLEELKKQVPSEKIFVWTETDLFPFIRENGESFVEKLTINREQGTIKVLDELAKYKNLAVHPCLHGLNTEDIEEITLQKNLSIDQLVDGLKILITHGIDIYPTFGSNVSAPEDLSELFRKLQKLNPYLPLRFALVQYDLSEYPDIEERLKEEPERKCPLYSKYTNLQIWNDLLKDHYDIGYAVIPRHLVQLKDCGNLALSSKVSMTSMNYKPGKQLLYIFKSSSREDYHRELLDILALPNGYMYKIEYDTNWVQTDLWQHMKMRPDSYEDQDALLFYVDVDSSDKKIIPLRKLTLKKVKVAGKVLALCFELGGFVEPICQKINLRRKLETLFGNRTLATTPLNKYVLLAEEIQELGKLKVNDDFPAWRATISQLHENNCKKFDKSLFYRVRVDGVTTALEEGAEIPTTIYEVGGGKKFSIHVEYYLPNYDNFPRNDPEIRKILYESSSDILKANKTNQFVLSKYGSDTLIFSTDENYRALSSTIHFQSPKIPFEAPMIDIPIRVKGSGTKIAAASVGSLVSSGLGGGILAASIPLFLSQNSGWSLLLIPGLLLLASGAVLGTKYRV